MSAELPKPQTPSDPRWRVAISKIWVEGFQEGLKKYYSQGSLRNVEIHHKYVK